MKNALSTVKEYQNAVNTLLYVYISYYICVSLKTARIRAWFYQSQLLIEFLIDNKFVSIIFDCTVYLAKLSLK